MKFTNALFRSDYMYLTDGIIFTIDNYTVTGKSPIDWDSTGEPIFPETELTEIGRLLKGYKYQNNVKNADQLAALTADFITQINELKSCSLLVPCPSTKFSAVVRLAAARLNISFQDCLRKKEAFSMKMIKKESRNELISRIECIEDISATEQIILIDDIVETGATMQACKNAIMKVQPNLPNIKMMALSRRILR